MAAPRPDTWMPLFWGDYARDTGHLNALMHGAYLMLIKHYWCTYGELPDDDGQLWRIACCDSKREWQKIRPVIEKFFTIRNGRWVHKRVDEEIERAVSNVEKRSKAGKEGAAKRWGGDDKANGKRIANASDSQWQTDGTSASPSPKEILSKSINTINGASRRPNFSDPSVRKQAWEQKIMAEITRRFTPAEANKIVIAYMEEEPWAKGKFEEISAEMNQRKALGQA